MSTYEDQQAARLASQAQVSADRDERRAMFQTVTTPAIVAGLAALEPGKGWRLEAPRDPGDRFNYNPRIVSVDGERFWLALDEYKHRITVHASYGNHANGSAWIPRDAIRGAVSPDPSMDAGKAPAALVKDIARRFLPAYRAILVTYREQFAHETTYRDETAANLARVLEAGQGRITAYGHEGSRESERRATFYNGDAVHGEIRVGGSYVTLERFSMPPAVACEILALLATRAVKDGAE